VHAPVIFHGRGHEGWHHWDHPRFERPIYHFDWRHIHYVTCTAQDANYENYPVTDDSYGGRWESMMSAVEDEALDFCYNTSGFPASCVLVGCTAN
jgi:hypothetical protein